MCDDAARSGALPVLTLCDTLADARKFASPRARVAVAWRAVRFPNAVTPVGKRKLAEKAAERLGETVEGATVIAPGGSLAGEFAKTTGTGRPPQYLNLVVTTDKLRVFKGILRDEFHEEQLARSCSEITRVERRKGVLRDRMRVTFANGERLEFKAVRGLAHGRDVVDLIAAKASLSIETLGKK